MPTENQTSFAKQYPQRILIVEDNPTNQKLLVKMLQRLGYEPRTAENGEIGLRTAEQEHFDTILMDLQMPVMDGIESARRIMSSDSIDQAIFISAFTANGKIEFREACLEVGMHDFYEKPARINELKGLLEKAHNWHCSQLNSLN